jgi:hypothetical protein
MCRSACFGHLHAHHQELTTALTASGFTLERGGSSVVGRGLAGCITGQTTTNNAQAAPTVKPEAPSAVVCS